MLYKSLSFHWAFPRPFAKWHRSARTSLARAHSRCCSWVLPFVAVFPTAESTNQHQQPNILAHLGGHREHPAACRDALRSERGQREGQNLRLFLPTSLLQINHSFYKALFSSFHADHPAPPQPRSRLAQGCLRQDILQGTASAQHTNNGALPFKP